MTLFGFILDGANAIYVEGDDAHGCILYMEVNGFQFYFYKVFINIVKIEEYIESRKASEAIQTELYYQIYYDRELTENNVQQDNGLSPPPFRPLQLSRYNYVPPPPLSSFGRLQIGRPAAAAASSKSYNKGINVPESRKGQGLSVLGIYGGRRTRKHKRRSRHTRRH